MMNHEICQPRAKARGFPHPYPRRKNVPFLLIIEIRKKIKKKFQKILHKEKINRKFAYADRIAEAPVWGIERWESARAHKESA